MRFICWGCEIEWRTPDDAAAGCCPFCSTPTEPAAAGCSVTDLARAARYHDPLLISGGTL